MKRVFKFAQLAGRPAYWPAAAIGVAATIEHQEALGALEFDCVVDVGANKGQFAAFAAARWGGARLYCFEPLPAPRAKLIRVLRWMAPGRSVVGATALGSSPGRSIIHLATREDSSSLLPLSDLQKSLFRMDDAGQLEIQVERLDEVDGLSVAGRALLKIDVQGYELEVLRGAARILKLFRHVYVEVSYVSLYVGQPLAKEVEGLLIDFGFEEAGRFNRAVGEDGVILQEDVLFVNKEKAR